MVHVLPGLYQVDAEGQLGGLQVRASAPKVGRAAFDLNADSLAPVAQGWEPAQGESVRLLTMGGSSGQVMSKLDGRGKFSVKVGRHNPGLPCAIPLQMLAAIEQDRVAHMASWCLL